MISMILDLIYNDMKYIKKDPMYIIGCIIPLILGLVYKFIISNINMLSDYLFVFQYLFISIIPMMVAMVLGFRVLDEKDERILYVYAVSPLKLSGYINFRIVQCSVLSFIQLIILSLFGITTKYNFALTIVIAVLLAPCLFLIISLIGKNKIQGMTILKLIGTIIVLPGLQVIGKNKWDFIFKFIPTDFILKSTYKNEMIIWGLCYICGISILIIILLSNFYKKSIKDI